MLFSPFDVYEQLLDLTQSRGSANPSEESSSTCVPGEQCQSGDGEPEAEYKDDALVSYEQEQKDLLQYETDLLAAGPSPEEKAETRKRMKAEWIPKLLGKRLVKTPSEDSDVSTATQDDTRDSPNDHYVRRSQGLI